MGKRSRSRARRTLPDEVEEEILLRLPVKTLKRFQCVCRSWYSLISSPQFINQHYRRAQAKLPLLLTLQSDQEGVQFRPKPSSIMGRYPLYNHIYNAHDQFLQLVRGNFTMFTQNFAKTLPHDSYNADRLALRFSSYNTDHQPTLSLVNAFTKTFPQPLFDGSMAGKPYMLSSRGLVCLASWSITNPPILIFNPATKDLISLPPTNQPNIRVGFGYAASSQWFKVVRFFAEGMQKDTRCEVLTLGTSNWRKAKNLPYRACDGTAPFFHGAVHCLPETSQSGVQKTDVISAFDIEIEEYRAAIPLPAFYYSLGTLADHKRRGIVDVRNFMRLTLLGGSLCVTFDFGEFECRLDLWILKYYDNPEWVKWRTIDVSSIYPYPSYSFWAYPTDNLVDQNILLNCSTDQGIKLLGYDPRNKVVTLKRENEWAATYYEETLYSLSSR